MSNSVIDLGKAKRETDLNESFLATFGFLVKSDTYQVVRILVLDLLNFLYLCRL